VSRRCGAEASRIEGIPLAAGPQNEEDTVHRGAVRDTRVVAAERVGLGRRQERLDALPEFIRDAPIAAHRLGRFKLGRFKIAFHHDIVPQPSEIGSKRFLAFCPSQLTPCRKVVRLWE
jgi:hypothetical protein